MSRPARTRPEFALDRLSDTRHGNAPTDPGDVPLVLFVGNTGVEDELLRAACRRGAVTVLAPNLQTALAWLGHGIEASGESAPSGSVTAMGEFTVDLESHQARWRGVSLGLTNLELRLIGALAERPGEVLSFENLSEKVWGSSYHGDHSMVRSAVQRLRRKVTQVGIRILSVRGIGFRLVDSHTRAGGLHPRPRRTQRPNRILHAEAFRLRRDRN